MTLYTNINIILVSLMNNVVQNDPEICTFFKSENVGRL